VLRSVEVWRWRPEVSLQIVSHCTDPAYKALRMQLQNDYDGKMIKKSIRESQHC
jgi:hypothetical protein